MYCIFFCSSDIKLSVKMVWESNTSQKVFLCKCKFIARDLGKLFGVDKDEKTYKNVW